MSDPNKQPNKLPTPGGSPNWGVMILMTVIVGILMVAFMFDGALTSPGRTISLDEFKKDYRAGKVVLNQPKEFPVEVTLDASSTEGVISAFEYRNVPQYPKAAFYMPFTDSDEIRALCNRFGITTTRVETAPQEPQGDRIWSTEDFARMGAEGRIITTGSSPVIYEGSGQGIIVGEYRLAPTTKPQLKELEPVRVEFNSAFQGEQVRDLLGNQVKYVVESNTWSMFLINVLPFAIVLLLLFFFFRAQGGGPGGAMKFARSRARLLDPSQNKVTFKDVAGISEAKEEVWEIVEFLRNPKKFRNLGGTIPKGVLMVGPPAPARPCWPGPLQAKRGSPSTQSPVPTLWKCLSVWVPAACATCLPKPRNTPPALSSSMKSMQ